MGKYQVLLTQDEYEYRVNKKWKGKIKVIGHYKGYYSSVEHFCSKCNKNYKMQPSHVLYGTYGCPFCADRILKENKTKEYAKKIKDKFNGNIRCLESYQGHNVPILHKCHKCGNEWKISPTFMMLRRNNGCSECNKKVIGQKVSQSSQMRTSKRFKKQKELYIQRLQDITNGRIILSKKDSFHGLYIDTLHHCNVHNLDFLFRPINISSRTKNMWICPQCIKENKLPARNSGAVKKVIQEKFPSIQVLLLNKEKLKSYFKCTVCGNEWESQFSNLLSSTVGCPQCARLKASKTQTKTCSQYKKELKLKYNGLYQIHEDYISDSTKIIHYCKKHNIEWLATPNSLLNGHGCPKCADRIKGFSYLADEWLKKRMKLDNVKIRTHLSRNGEYTITLNDGSIAKVDGFAKETNTIYEFYGDAYHGNPLVYKPDEYCHPFLHDVTAFELLKRTMEREFLLKQLGYTVITIWEYDYLRGAI